MMRDMQADWKLWSRTERIVASLMIACGVSLAVASMFYFQV
jgi:hypothetical protein